jgi:hypothetical protein
VTESPQKLIPFAKLFEIAAIHIFDDPSLIEFIPDGNNAIASPDILRKTSADAAIQLSLLHSKHDEIMKLPASEMDAETRIAHEKERDALQEKISATLQKWILEALLRDYEERFEKRNRAAIVAEKLLNTCAEGKISLFLNSETKLPPTILSRNSGARFLPKESILECEIDGEIRSGIVCGDENEVREWLAGEDVAAGVYDTREKRQRKCAELYEARLLDPKTCNCPADEHFTAIKEVIQGLLRKEFYAVRDRLAQKFPHINKPGRRPKTHPEI